MAADVPALADDEMMLFNALPADGSSVSTHRCVVSCTGARTGTSPPATDWSTKA